MIYMCKQTAEGDAFCGVTLCCACCKDMATCDDVCELAKAGKQDECDDRIEKDNELAAFESEVPAAIQDVTDILVQMKELEAKSKDLKKQLLEAMERYEVKSFENDRIKMTYVAPTTRTSLDSKRLKADYPYLFDEYAKTSKVSASVRITVK